MSSEMSILFGEVERGKMESRKKQKVKEKIRDAGTEELKEEDQEEYIDDLIGLHDFETPDLRVDDREGVKKERFGKIYLEVRIPVDGPATKLRYNPSTLEWPVMSIETIEYQRKDGGICFEIRIDDSSAEEIQKEIDEKISLIEKHLEALKADFERLENEIKEEAAALYDEQVSSSETADEILAELDMPTRDETDQ